MRPDAVRTLGRRHHRVRTQDTALHWSNDLPVLATPVLLWLAEMASMDAMRGMYDGDEMCVGLRHETAEHLAPSLEGADVDVRAELLAVTGRTVTFDVTAHDRDRLVFRGRHTRAVVSRSRFEESLSALDPTRCDPTEKTV